MKGVKGLNKNLLRAEMATYGDTQETLAAGIGISLSRLNAKINDNGGEFTMQDVGRIRDRYHLSPDRLVEIFFA